MATHESTNGRAIIRTAGLGTHTTDRPTPDRLQAEQAHADLAHLLDELAAATVEMTEAQQLADLAAENRDRAIANYHAAYAEYEQSFRALQALLMEQHRGGRR